MLKISVYFVIFEKSVFAWYKKATEKDGQYIDSQYLHLTRLIWLKNVQIL